MCEAPPFRHLLRLADLPSDRDHEFLVKPDSEANAAIAGLLGIVKLRKPRLVGRLSRLGGDGWRLDAELGATVTQDCVVTLAPVVTRIDRPVVRAYLANTDAPSGTDGTETPMDMDDSVEALSPEIDLGAVLVEELALALPLYPRAEDARPFEARYGPTGAGPLDDAAMKPFADLAKLRKPTASDRIRRSHAATQHQQAAPSLPPADRLAAARMAPARGRIRSTGGSQGQCTASPGAH